MVIWNKSYEKSGSKWRPDRWLLALLCCLVCGCQKAPKVPLSSTPKRAPSARKIKWTPAKALHPTDAVPFRDNGALKPLLRSIEQSLRYLRRPSSQKKTYHFGSKKVTHQALALTLIDLQQKLLAWGLRPKLFAYLQSNYHFFESAAKKKVLVTGYYEASLNGAKERTERFRYPLYRKPRDLVTVKLSDFSWFRKATGVPSLLRLRMTPTGGLVPYYTRAEIDYQHKLAGQQLELVWVDDPIDAFFLHIQGSGVVSMTDGSTLRVNYAQKNGHRYYAIGRTLIKEGLASRKEMSMQRIREYLQKHPKRQQEIFSSNPSYIFFRAVKEGPLGSLGVPVTAYRSIATDRRLFPHGALALLRTRIGVFDHKGKQTGWKPITRLVLNQDTGGAIKGPGRVDLFTGFGPKSEQVAGHQKERGQLFFLLKK